MNRPQTFRRSSFYVGCLRSKLVCNNSLSPFHKIVFQAVQQGILIENYKGNKNTSFFWFMKRKSFVYSELNLMPWQSKPHHMFRYLPRMINHSSSMGLILTMKVRSIHGCFKPQVSWTLDSNRAHP